MPHPRLRIVCIGLTAVAIGAGAGLAFLQAFQADAAPPPAALTPQPAPAAGSLDARQPAPLREGTPAPYVRDMAPLPPPPQGRERGKPASEGKKGSTPWRTKLTQHVPRIVLDEGRLAEVLEDLGVPPRMRRWLLSW